MSYQIFESKEDVRNKKNQVLLQTDIYVLKPEEPHSPWIYFRNERVQELEEEGVNYHEALI